MSAERASIKINSADNIVITWAYKMLICKLAFAKWQHARQSSKRSTPSRRYRSGYTPGRCHVTTPEAESAIYLATLRDCTQHVRRAAYGPAEPPCVLLHYPRDGIRRELCRRYLVAQRYMPKHRPSADLGARARVGVARPGGASPRVEQRSPATGPPDPSSTGG
jgi:hypothetical protein